jgi:hypothetical protein
MDFAVGPFQECFRERPFATYRFAAQMELCPCNGDRSSRLRRWVGRFEIAFLVTLTELVASVIRRPP